MQQAYHQSSRFKTQADKKAQGKAKKKKKKAVSVCQPSHGTLVRVTSMNSV